MTCIYKFRIYIYIYIYTHTRVSSFPGLISVARVNEQRTYIYIRLMNDVYINSYISVCLKDRLKCYVDNLNV